MTTDLAGGHDSSSPGSRRSRAPRIEAKDSLRAGDGVEHGRVLRIERDDAAEIADGQTLVQRYPRLLAGAPLEDPGCRHTGVDLGGVGGIDELAGGGCGLERGVHRVEGPPLVRALVDAVLPGADVQEFRPLRVELQQGP